ncbi:hypothetical protein [Pseudomonas koreensis]|jgi:hypothetical protein|uniref:F4 family fimbrial subunit n=1 Tax=Pseudomonas koreensis TaxID=198620 RepID=UPI001B339DA4|nr:hypothetical protein [Pseudomonas koreensis]MBP3996450.1 hypothetical protein [Pseudomonas koreensis]
MKTNNLYLVVAAVALGLSSNAMALTFTDGGFTGGVDIGGDVTVPEAVNHWQWAAGDAISFASSPATQMTNAYKTLTLPAASNLPLLVGQTSAATAGNPGNVGLSPQIAFTDAAGATVTPVWDTTGNTGKGNITLPVTAADGTTALGSMTMRVKVGAVRAAQSIPTPSLLYSYYSSDSATVLFGHAAQPLAANGALPTGTIAAQWNTDLGAKTVTDLRDQLSAASGVTITTWNADATANASAGGAFDRPDSYYSGTYGLGIAQGDSLTVNFNNPVTVTTQWKSALKAIVTHL